MWNERLSTLDRCAFSLDRSSPDIFTDLFRMTLNAFTTGNPFLAQNTWNYYKEGFWDYKGVKSGTPLYRPTLYRRRSVVRWIRRGRTTAQAPRADRTFEGGTLSKKRAAPDADGAGTKSESGAANGYGAAERDACKNWTLRIFREPTALLESTCAVDDGSDGGSGGGRSSSATYHAGNTGSDANTTDSGNRDGSGVCLSRFGTNSEEQGGRGPPLLVVNALRVPLPPVPAVPTAAVAEGARLTAPRRGGPSGAGSAPALRSEWRNPFSWLARYYWRSDGEECRDLEPALSMAPPPPPLVPPRVIVRVVYVGRAPDVARFAREVERLGEVQDCAAATAATAVATGAAGCPDAGASLAAGDGHVTQPSDVEGATVDGATPRTAEGSATVVELVRSEVRVRRACVPAKAARENPERGCTEGADADSGLVPRSATQLQVSASHMRNRRLGSEKCWVWIRGGGRLRGEAVVFVLDLGRLFV